ncbi:thiamine phosphate synthase [Chelatococcus reniformis]|uniref:Thiamine phosphate synthase n=1 Tax=Chelatococcus reniformis TaxID=1494448 RepID=A0A916U9Q6_9HYPH|nr:thiamine phosphate synthase [Chelatococcus reniformis]GGC64312.1 thiamine phosphate synthase [Chelatococcus reniformis]
MAEPARLYLMTPTIADAQAFAPLLAQVCASGNVAAVLIDLPRDDERSTINRIKCLAPIVQERGAALLVTASPQAAVRGGADGVHLSGADPATLRDATGTLQPDRIVGVGALSLRHDAMVAGEVDVDYVMFGEPRADGFVPDVEATVERAAWWAELFAVPCVAYAAQLDAVPLLASTGAEFVALGDAVFNAPEGPAAAVARACDLLAGAETVLR